MPTATHFSTFVQIFNKDNNCIVVKRGGKYHVRQYPRNIKGGKPRYKMEVFCHYGNLPSKIGNLFKNAQLGKK